jgi:cobalt-zinc-cadmium efflux system protein
MHTHGKSIGWAIVVNLIITICEYIGGVLSGSLALISDAAHNLSDVISLTLSWIGEKLTGKKPSAKYTFGWKRMEIFTALINALALWGIAFYIVYESFQRFADPPHIILSIMIPIASISLLGNVISMIILHKDKHETINLKAAYLHLFYDAISSLAVIAAAIIMKITGNMVFDLIISFTIAAMIFWGGLDILKKAVHILMMGTPDDIEISEVYKSIASLEHVRDVHNLHLWSINSQEVFLSCHIVLDCCPSHENDEILQSVKTLLWNDYGIEHHVIQLENELQCRSSAPGLF